MRQIIIGFRPLLALFVTDAKQKFLVSFAVLSSEHLQGEIAACLSLAQRLAKLS
jgi:hypothetical protein